MEKYELGLKKKSFSIYYRGGAIWCEHLDALYDRRDLVKEKFMEDLKQIQKPSTSGYLLMVFDETEMDEELIGELFEALGKTGKLIRKIAIVGLNRSMKKAAIKRCNAYGFINTCIDDMEKAKEWLI